MPLLNCNELVDGVNLRLSESEVVANVALGFQQSVSSSHWESITERISQVVLSDDSLAMIDLNIAKEAACLTVLVKLCKFRKPVSSMFRLVALHEYQRA